MAITKRSDLTSCSCRRNASSLMHDSQSWFFSNLWSVSLEASEV